MAKDLLPQPTPYAPRPVLPAKLVAPTKVCLVIVFNHHYDGNLPKLDHIYGKRFTHLRYLMPFYRGERADVFPVYYSSHQFQGYFMEAWRRLQHEGFTHFVFCADDVLLHPNLTEDNICEQVGVDADSGYTKDLRSLTEFDLRWFATASGLVAMADRNGLNWEKELPAYDIAAANLESKGFPLGRFGWKNVRRGVNAKAFFQSSFYLVHRWLKRRTDPKTRILDLPYPLLAGYSDLLIVPTAAMDQFSFFCSVFAAAGLFVEIGAPTALALSCPRLVRETDTKWKPRDWWHGGEKELEAFGRRFDFRLDQLLANFGERELYLHPIKFSKWSI